MYSPSITRYFPNACCNPAWNSFRNPGGEFAGTHGIKAAITPTLHPVVEITRFSLNGVSRVRAYDRRSTVLVRLMLYARPSRGSAWLVDDSPRYRSPRIPRLKDQFPLVIVSWTNRAISFTSACP